jgi:hypothetical protein
LKKKIGKTGKKRMKRKKTGKSSIANGHFGEEVNCMAKKKGKKGKKKA